MTWLPSVVTVAPATEPISRDDAKLFCRVDALDEDEMFDTLILGARHLIEQHTGTGLITQTRSLLCSDFADLASLPVGPVQSITSIKYLDSTGTEQTLSSSVYQLVTSGLLASIRLKPGQSWPEIYPVGDAIRIVAVIGYGAAIAVPGDILVATKFLVYQWYDNRTPYAERVPTELPNTVTTLLANRRMF